MSPLDILLDKAGLWTGTYRLNDPASGRALDSAATAEVVPVLDGRFVRLDYTWGYLEKPQQGSLLIGGEPESGKIL